MVQPRKDFADELAHLALTNVTVLNMASRSLLGVKLQLELDDTAGKYLLYFPYPEPDVEKDWLLDIKLYSRCFYADRTSILFNSGLTAAEPARASGKAGGLFSQ